MTPCARTPARVWRSRIRWFGLAGWRAKPPAWMPALALFDGDSLERRVRRLLDPEPLAASETPFRSAGAALVGLVAGAVAGFAIGSRPLHDVMEWAVRNLP